MTHEAHASRLAWHQQRIEELEAELRWHRTEARRMVSDRLLQKLRPNMPRQPRRVQRGEWKRGQWRDA